MYIHVHMIPGRDIVCRIKWQGKKKEIICVLIACATHLARERPCARHKQLYQDDKLFGNYCVNSRRLDFECTYWCSCVDDVFV